MYIRTLPATYKGDFSWHETDFFYRAKSNANLTSWKVQMLFLTSEASFECIWKSNFPSLLSFQWEVVICRWEVVWIMKPSRLKVEQCEGKVEQTILSFDDPKWRSERIEGMHGLLFYRKRYGMLHDYCLHEMTNRAATTPNKMGS